MSFQNEPIGIIGLQLNSDITLSKIKATAGSQLQLRKTNVLMSCQTYEKEEQFKYQLFVTACSYLDLRYLKQSGSSA